MPLETLNAVKLFYQDNEHSNMKQICQVTLSQKIIKHQNYE